LEGFADFFLFGAMDPRTAKLRARRLRSCQAGADTLLNTGASPHEIMSVTGHKTLSEVQWYTAAERARLAESTMGKLKRKP
jgi:site-specific recombinase XerD